ncbi:EXS-domain-containing protein, partial [Caulochytrium protostelioides]
MVRTLGRILTSGLHPVQFRDFFLCDILSSLTYTFSALEIFFCSVWAGFNNIADQCQFHGSWAVPAVTAIPAYFRFIQCVRRYYDERVIWPHLPNAMKYVLSLTTIFLSTNARNNRTPASLALWLVAAFTTAFYAWWWDVYFDWSFVQRDRTAKYGFKWRKQHFPYKWVYWAVPIQNFILRLSFIILISPNQWGLFIGSRTLVWIMALFELWRRVVWCIFRMENEHNTNVGRFRAT